MPATTLDRPELQLRSQYRPDPFKPFSAASQELPDVPAPSPSFTFSSGLTPYAGPWTAVQAAHLLRRIGFGVKKADLDLLKGMSFEAAMTHIFSAPSAPTPPVNDYNNPDFTDPDVSLGDSWVTAAYNVEAEGYRIQSWRGWWYDLLANQGANISEKMTLFWHNHFATQTDIVYWGRGAYDLNTKFRANALGNFKTLTKAVTLDGMMLIYLNGYLNTKGAPDENYARELQELFTIGKDNPDHYTEDDVVAAARVLTGWKVDINNNTSFNYAIDHDFDNKQFSAFYNNTVIQGSPFAEQELDAMLDMIFEKNEVAEYLCRKLYRWFVYYHIDSTTEQNVIQPLAQIMRDNNYEVLPVLEALFKSDHFFETAQSGCMIKTPIDIVVGVMRSFNTTVTGTTPWDKFLFQLYMSYYMSGMKMLMGDPPNVAGWQAFRQTPQYYRLWINGDTLRLRNQFTDVMCAYYFETDNDQLKFDLPGFVAQFDNPGDPNALIDDITSLLLPEPLSAAKKFVLKSILLSGLPNDSYWTNAWDDYVNNPTDPMAVEAVSSRLLIFHLYITRLPEFQLA